MKTKFLLIFVTVIIVVVFSIVLIILTTASSKDDKSHKEALPEVSGSKSEETDAEKNDSNKVGEIPEKKLAEAKKIMANKIVEETYKSEAQEYSNNISTKFEDKYMIKTGKRRPNTDEISSFGIGLLSMYQSDNTKTEYLKIVEDLIRKMEAQLNSLGNVDSVPWGDNWFALSITYPRMLAMYEYIGNNKEIKDICHDRIKKLIPKLNRSLGKERSHAHLVSMGIARLLTDKLNDPPQYERDIQTPEFQDLQKELSPDFNESNSVAEGIYQDYSCIHNTNVPTFSAKLSLGGFYSNMYTWLGFKSTLVDSVTKILDKTVHPNMDFIAYGLFSRDPRITCKETLDQYWPNYDRNKNNDVYIFPFIGLGVFKSNDFIFSVRVQRNGIAAYEYNKSYNKYALGWIQMRKLYVAGVDYDSYNGKMEWNDLKLQPGVISFAEDSENKFDKFSAKNSASVYTSDCENVQSYIGHLKASNGKNLLYWFNKYQFKDFYGPNVEIMEIGVCTDEGLVMHYEISNNSGKELKLILKDKDIKTKMNFEASPNDPGTGIPIPSGGDPVKVNWSQLFHVNVKPKEVSWKNANNSMGFTFEEKMYLIEQFDGYHIVKCEGKIILAGNSSSLRNDSITHNGIKYTRNSDTLMYEPPKNN